MNKLRKYALAAALVLPTVFGLGANRAKADSIVINKEVAGAVNVRSSAEETNNIIGTIDDESKSYEIKDEVNGWFKIDFEGKEAYVGMTWFNVRKETEVVAPANFRKEPNLSSEIHEVLEEGSKVTLLEESENGFVKVSYEGKEGYIYHNLLKAIVDKKAEAKAKQASQNTSPASNNQASYTESYEASYTEPTYTEPATEYYEEETTSYQGDSNWAKEWIAQRESGGSYTAYNPNGGYYGRYQLNPSLVSYGASPAAQEAAADSYVYSRYGSWENAQAFWAANGWY